MIGKGRRDVKHELSPICLAMCADVSIISLTFFITSTRSRTGIDRPAALPQSLGSEVSRR